MFIFIVARHSNLPLTLCVSLLIRTMVFDSFRPYLIPLHWYIYNMRVKKALTYSFLGPSQIEHHYSWRFERQIASRRTSELQTFDRTTCNANKMFVHTHTHIEKESERSPSSSLLLFISVIPSRQIFTILDDFFWPALLLVLAFPLEQTSANIFFFFKSKMRFYLTTYIPLSANTTIGWQTEHNRIYFVASSHFTLFESSCNDFTFIFKLHNFYTCYTISFGMLSQHTHRIFSHHTEPSNSPSIHSNNLKQ